ncbi:hypothetical protein RhiirA4_427510 [Rhizophagus irregularis]|uniref:Uncharacterized protein n=1 Tax=Rhizophagus irregularis TaxID=588596 RepID=A0A2I1H988_9GLOM|nr:hypothetical protein RhiirA4_427510 [Rhizophagus irregularis]
MVYGDLIKSKLGYYGDIHILPVFKLRIIKDKPNFKVDQIFLDEVDVPDIAICGTPELRILRCDLKTHSNIGERIDGCNNYILPSAADYGIFKSHCLTFKANKTIKFAKPNSDIDGLQKIGFYFYDNTTAAEMNTLGIASLTIQLTPPDFNLNSLTNTDKAISQMDKAILSEFKLQLNFIAGMVNYAAVVKFKTSTYRSILPGDTRAIFGLNPNYHVTRKIENFINYFPFNSNPYDIPVGTTGYFSIAAGSFTQEQTSEERSNTVLSAIAAAGGAFGVTAGVIVFFFGDYRLSPRGFVHKFLHFIQNSKEIFRRTSIYYLLYSKSELKFSSINGDDKNRLVAELTNIRSVVYYHQLYQSNNIAKKINKSEKRFINRLENKINKISIIFNRIKTELYYWLFNAIYVKDMFKKYGEDRNRLEFSSINEQDKKLLNDEIDKIRHVIDVYLLGKPVDSKKIAAYKYERELKFSDNTNNELYIINEDQKLLNDEFRKIRKLIDKHLLGKPDIEEIFDAYNFLKKNDFSKEGNTLQNNNLSEDMELLNDVFQQISYVIFRHLLDIPEDEKLFNEYKKTVQISSFSKMNDHDKKLLVDEFDKIKHVINCHLFNERKILEKFKKYIKERELVFLSNMSKEDNELLNDKFSKIREVIDNFLLNKPTHTYLDFSDNMNDRDKESLLSYIDNVNNEIYNIRNDIDKYILNKV